MKMPSSLMDATLPTAESESPGCRAEHLLRTMRKTLTHDLPNQLVVLQSLVHLLQTEEGDRLSVDGQEYTQRIQNVARKATGLVRFLKEMSRLSDYVAQAEEIALPVLARELKAVLVQMYPQRKLSFSWSWAVPTVCCDYRMLYQALLELLQYRIEHAAKPVAAIQAGSLTGRNGTEIFFAFQPPADLPDQANSHTKSATPFETPLAALLAREWLAQADARLETGGNLGDGFVIQVPESPPHG